MNYHEQLIVEMNLYLNEYSKLITKNNKAAARRARISLSKIYKLIVPLRKEIQVAKKAI